MPMLCPSQDRVQNVHRQPGLGRLPESTQVLPREGVSCAKDRTSQVRRNKVRSATQASWETV